MTNATGYGKRPRQAMRAIGEANWRNEERIESDRMQRLEKRKRKKPRSTSHFSILQLKKSKVVMLVETKIAYHEFNFTAFNKKPHKPFNLRELY